jgi:hypothetical protein
MLHTDDASHPVKKALPGEALKRAIARELGDLSKTPIDLLCLIYECAMAAEDAWLRLAEDRKFCEHEADRAFYVRHIVATELAGRGPERGLSGDGDDKKRWILAHWVWTSGGDDEWMMNPKHRAATATA